MGELKMKKESEVRIEYATEIRGLVITSEVPLITEVDILESMYNMENPELEWNWGIKH